MKSLWPIAWVFLAIALVVASGGIGVSWYGAEVTDNSCFDVSDCRDRDVRATELQQLGQTLILGGLLVLVLSTVLFVAAARGRDQE